MKNTILYDERGRMYAIADAVLDDLSLYREENSDRYRIEAQYSQQHNKLYVSSKQARAWQQVDYEVINMEAHVTLHGDLPSDINLPYYKLGRVLSLNNIEESLKKTFGDIIVAYDYSITLRPQNIKLTQNSNDSQ